MLLRSSSTPVITSLLSPFSDSPNRDLETTTTTTTTTRLSHFLHYHHSNSPPGISKSNQESNSFGLKGFRRARSDSNLQGLAAHSCGDTEDFLGSHKQNNSFHKPHRSMLRSEPSFCIYSADGGEEDGVRPEDLERELKRTVTIGDNIEAVGSGGFSFNKKHMVLIEEEEKEEDEDVLNGTQSLSVKAEIKPPSRPASPPLYLATGLGIDDANFIGGGDNFDLNLPNLDEEGDVEEYYKKMLDEHPYHPLLLRNYAQLLQNKGDLCEAEEYYYRATLADPDDGEILSKYAKLVWELHHDQEKALIYFDRALQAAPQDSHVLAAYASFLWDVDDDGEEDRTAQEYIQMKEKARLNDRDNPALAEVIPAGIQIEVANIAVADANIMHEDIEDYYMRMAEENPCNAVVLRNYAQFLSESKGDLEGAEEYYSRAVVADPQDGEVKSQYAKLVWELHHDHNKASSYFEQAVQAAPQNR